VSEKHCNLEGSLRDVLWRETDSMHLCSAVYCILGFLNMFDILDLINFAGIAFLLQFVRLEYRRNRDDCIWKAVSQY